MRKPTVLFWVRLGAPWPEKGRMPKFMAELAEKNGGGKLNIHKNTKSAQMCTVRAAIVHCGGAVEPIRKVGVVKLHGCAPVCPPTSGALHGPLA